MPFYSNLFVLVAAKKIFITSASNFSKFALERDFPKTASGGSYTAISISTFPFCKKEDPQEPGV
jgi:hypothetical protein